LWWYSHYCIKHAHPARHDRYPNGQRHGSVSATDGHIEQHSDDHSIGDGHRKCRSGWHERISGDNDASKCADRSCECHPHCDRSAGRRTDRLALP